MLLGGLVISRVASSASKVAKAAGKSAGEATKVMQETAKSIKDNVVEIVSKVVKGVDVKNIHEVSKTVVLEKTVLVVWATTKVIIGGIVVSEAIRYYAPPLEPIIDNARIKEIITDVKKK